MDLRLALIRWLAHGRYTVIDGLILNTTTTGGLNATLIDLEEEPVAGKKKKRSKAAGKAAAKAKQEKKQPKTKGK